MTPSLLQDALQYRRRQWSVIPIAADKKPPSGFGWKRWQSELPPEESLRAWFQNPRVSGVAVLLGPVSGGLYCRDFDVPAAYPAWAAQNPTLAKKLPTVATQRGAHVYFAADADLRTLDLGDGELRGAGGYCLLPPSLHPSGGRYCWQVPMPPGRPPLIDPYECNLVQSGTELTEDTEQTERTEVNRSGIGLGASNITTIKAAVDAALPTQRHSNHRALFILARALLSLQRHRDTDLSDAERDAAFAQWYSCAKPHLREGQSRDAYLFEFYDAWHNAKYPLEDGYMQDAVKRAMSAPLPTIAGRFESPDVRFLVAVCRELQRLHGDKPFYLSCRVAARLLNHPTHSTAAFYLRGLERAKIIRHTEKGSADTNRATRFRYLHPLDA